MSAVAGGPTTAAPTIPAPGFADPTRSAQTAFRSVLDALAHPGTAYPLVGPAEPPAALGRGLAAIALTVLDEECTLWLGGPMAASAEVAAWLAFHTGARRVDDPADADFVIAPPASRPALAALAPGTDESPDRSTTVVLDVRDTAGDLRCTASGPGIDGATTVALPWADAAFVAEWAHNGALFPRGVDLLLVDTDHVHALPRTTRLTALESDQEA